MFRRLAALSHTHVATLHSSPSSPSASVDIIPISSFLSDSRKSSIEVPPDAHTLLSSHDLLAIVGIRSLTVVDHPLSSSPNTRRVAATLFQSRPGLSVTYAAWAPHAPAFLLVLTSDATLRLYDVASRDDVSLERLRLRVVTNGSAPTCFAFSRSRSSWGALAVYILTADSSIYVVSPLAPIGTRLSMASWTRMREDAERRRDAALADTDGPVDSWPLQQAEMQLRFLDHVFESTPAGDMVAVREFKPAPLLFQGPLFIEHDDEIESTSQPEQSSEHRQSVSLSVLNCGPNIPPVILRASKNGHISVLIAMEPLEPQWFFNTQNAVLFNESNVDTDAGTCTAVLEASEDYAACAAQVAPSLLCFERVVLDDGPSSITSLGNDTNADVVFISTRHAVYSLRLSFVAALSDVSSLERSTCSVVSRILTTTTHVDSDSEVADDQRCHDSREIVGVVSHYARHIGPVAIVLTGNGMLHTTAPLRWVSHLDTGALPPSTSPSSRAYPNPESGRVYACAGLGKDANDLLAVVADAERLAGGVVARGTLGIAKDVANSAHVLGELERRVMHYTGSIEDASDRKHQEQSGVSDCLGELSSVLSAWSNELVSRAEEAHRLSVGEVANSIAEIAICEAKTRRQLEKVIEAGSVLDERIRVLMHDIEASKVELSPLEAARLQKLRDRSRRLAARRGHLKELALAVQASRKKVSSTLSNGSLPDRIPVSPLRPSGARVIAQAGSPAGRSPFKHQSPVRRLSFGRKEFGEGGPLAKKRSEWVESSGRTALSLTDLQRIRVALEKHSEEIALATQLDSLLRKKLSVS